MRVSLIHISKILHLLQWPEKEQWLLSWFTKLGVKFDMCFLTVLEKLTETQNSVDKYLDKKNWPLKLASKVTNQTCLLTFSGHTMGTPYNMIFSPYRSTFRLQICKH